MNMRYKRECVILITRVTEILAKHDPLGFVSGVAPRTEYSQEATLIVANLRHCFSIFDIDNLVIEIYKNQFENEYLASNIKTYEQAKDIFSAHKDYLSNSK